ncbi:MAG: hypothetical protein WA885_03845 [Phormidesmis sp.]
MNVSSQLKPQINPQTHQLAAHPWPTGHLFESLGAHLTYRVVGPCCRLYDRDQLPWPCCRVQWRSKEPSWRRVGRRFTVDLATRNRPSYCVEIVGQSYRSEPIVMTIYTEKLPMGLRDWWHSQRVSQVQKLAVANSSRIPQPQNPKNSPETIASQANDPSYLP